MKNAYEILELTNGAKATGQEIKKAYHLLARKYHPDKSSGNTEETTIIFQAISGAYQQLIDPEKRQKYDEQLLKEAFNAACKQLCSLAIFISPGVFADFIEQFKTITRTFNIENAGLFSLIAQHIREEGDKTFVNQFVLPHNYVAVVKDSVDIFLVQEIFEIAIPDLRANPHWIEHLDINVWIWFLWKARRNAPHKELRLIDLDYLNTSLVYQATNLISRTLGIQNSEANLIQKISEYLDYQYRSGITSLPYYSVLTNLILFYKNHAPKTLLAWELLCQKFCLLEDNEVILY